MSPTMTTATFSTFADVAAPTDGGYLFRFFLGFARYFERTDTVELLTPLTPTDG